MFTYESIPNPARSKNTGLIKVFGSECVHTEISPNHLINDRPPTPNETVKGLFHAAYNLMLESACNLVIVEPSGFDQPQEVVDKEILTGFLAGAVDIISGAQDNNKPHVKINSSLRTIRDKRAEMIKRNGLTAQTMAYALFPHTTGIAISVVPVSSGNGNTAYDPLWLKVMPETEHGFSITTTPLPLRLHLPPASTIMTGIDASRQIPKYLTVDAQGNV
jgi:hypothetical protein